MNNQVFIYSVYPLLGGLIRAGITFWFDTACTQSIRIKFHIDKTMNIKKKKQKNNINFQM